MPNLIPNSNTLSMSSREIAELVGSRHDKVKQSIERLAVRKKGAMAMAAPIDLPPLGEYLDVLGRPATEYVFSGEKGKRDSIVVVAQLSPEFTARLVDRWQELEAMQAPRIPQSLSEALRLAADQAEQIEQQAAQLAIAAPKVEFVDKYVENTGSMTFRQVAKLLKANERELRELLISGHVMYRLNGVLTPYQNHIDVGRFELKTGTSERNNHAFAQARFTPKGVQWIAGLWASHSMQRAA